MEFDPPIATRSTDELIEIANYPENWNPKAVELANSELDNRGVTVEEQDEKVSKWNKEAEKEYRKEMQSRAIESFGLLQLAWMAIRWPYSLLSDWHLKSEGYHKMHKERLLSILAGLLLWVSFGFYADNYERTQRPWQNEVNRQDIYEWEREYYSDEELANFRTESIEQVVETVRKNESNGTPTIVILESDTISNSEVEKLRNLDPLAIRNIIFEGDFEPRLHEWITIKLVKPADNSTYE